MTVAYTVIPAIRNNYLYWLGLQYLHQFTVCFTWFTAKSLLTLFRFLYSHYKLLLLQPFYGPLAGTTCVSRHQKKHSPTHLFWSSSNLYQLLPSTTIYSILFSIYMFDNLFAQPLSKSSFGLPLGLEPLTSYSIHFFTNQCLLFATQAHTIATCFAVVQRLYHLFLVSLTTLYLELYLQLSQYKSPKMT